MGFKKTVIHTEYTGNKIRLVDEEFGSFYNSIVHLYDTDYQLLSPVGYTLSLHEEYIEVYFNSHVERGFKFIAVIIK
jgi:hypothetical protein